MGVGWPAFHKLNEFGSEGFRLKDALDLNPELKERMRKVL